MYTTILLSVIWFDRSELITIDKYIPIVECRILFKQQSIPLRGHKDFGLIDFNSLLITCYEFQIFVLDNWLFIHKAEPVKNKVHGTEVISVQFKNTKQRIKTNLLGYF